jgi:ankyrin repeat protein
MSSGRNLVRGVMGYNSEDSNYNNYNSNNYNSNNSDNEGYTAPAAASGPAPMRVKRDGEWWLENTVNSFDNYLKSPEAMLYIAAINEDIDTMSDIMSTNNLSPDLIIKYLDRQLNLRINYDNEQESLLKIAFFKKKPRSISFLIDKGADILPIIKLGEIYDRESYRTTLYLAIENNYTDVVNKILSKELPSEFINYVIPHGKTSLKLAVHLGNIEYVKRLIEAGAIPNRINNSASALELALAKKSYEIADFLKQSGATMPAMTNFSISEYSSNLKHDLNTLNWIIKNYVNELGLPQNTYTKMPYNPEDFLFKIANVKDKSLLMYQIFSLRHRPMYDSEKEERRRNLFRPLLNNIDSSGNTALMAATVANNITLVELLIMFGAKTAIQNNEGNTALHLAALNTIDKTEEERQIAINIINGLIQVNQGLTKIKNNAGYGAGNPKLGVSAEITRLIHSQKPWFRTVNTNKTKQGGRKSVSRNRIVRRVKTMKVKKSKCRR